MSNRSRARCRAGLDADETGRALIWLNERYFSTALGRGPQTDAAKVVDILERIWISTLYGAAAGSRRT